MWYLFRFSRDPPCARSYCGDLCRRLRDLVSFEDIGELWSIWAPVGRFGYVLTHGVARHGTAWHRAPLHCMVCRGMPGKNRETSRHHSNGIRLVQKPILFLWFRHKHNFTENPFRCFRSHRYVKWEFLFKAQIRIGTPSRFVFRVFENHVVLYKL